MKGKEEEGEREGEFDSAFTYPTHRTLLQQNGSYVIHPPSYLRRTMKKSSVNVITANPHNLVSKLWKMKERNFNWYEGMTLAN